MSEIVISLHETEKIDSIQALLKSIGWADQYVRGQINNILKLQKDEEGEVFVATDAEWVVGFIQVQHYQWNRLSQLQGLVVSLQHRKQGVARKLVDRVELSAKERGNRGLYVDTPVDNSGGRAFYCALGFKEGYIMPEYYDVGLDGITFQKLFE